MEEASELQVLATINQMLTDLDDPAAISRVLAWINAKHEFSASPSPRATASPVQPVFSQDGDSTFESVADLFDAANPNAESEKVLVVGYWFQELQQKPDFDSQTINTELKNLGHGVGNVTRALSYLIDRSPRFAIQVRKIGTNRQGRKRYKITVEGIRRVKELLNGSATTGGEE